MQISHGKVVCKEKGPPFNLHRGPPFSKATTADRKALSLSPGQDNLMNKKKRNICNSSNSNIPVFMVLQKLVFAEKQWWDYCHFHKSECKSLSYESESTKTQDHESECESESKCHESKSIKTENHESEFEKFENLTGKWNLKFGQSHFNMNKRFQKFRKKTFVQRFCKRCTVF